MVAKPMDQLVSPLFADLVWITSPNTSMADFDGFIL